MKRIPRHVSAPKVLLSFLVISNVLILREGFTGSSRWYVCLLITIPLLLLTLKKRTG